MVLRAERSTQLRTRLVKIPQHYVTPKLTHVIATSSAAPTTSSAWPVLTSGDLPMLPMYVIATSSAVPTTSSTMILMFVLYLTSLCIYILFY